MSNSHIDNLVNAVVNKISAVVNNHNSSSNAHSSLFSTKQDILVSGTSIKTINNQSVLGSGNISISGGSGSSDCLTDFSYDSTNDELVLEYCSGKLIDNISKTTNGLVDTYTITYTDSTTYEFTVTNGSGGGNNGSVTVDSTWVSNSTNPVESKLIKTALDGKADSSHTHTISNITDFPTIPSKISDLTDDSEFIKTSNTAGLIKNDGSVMTSGTGSSNYAAGNHTHSQYLTTSNVVDNLTSTSSTDALSAKQGKVLNDLIGAAITYINQ